MKMMICSFLVLTLTFVFVYSQTSEDFKDFLDSSVYTGYNKKIFPKEKQTDKLTVYMKFYLIAITNFDEIAGQLQLVGYIEVSWTNDLIKDWTNVMSEMLLPQDNFWRPALVLSNSVESLAELGDSSYKIRINKDGTHSWTVGVVSKTGCAVDVSYYPFDTQSCQVKFTPWGYYDNQVFLENTTDSIDKTHYQENVEWEVTGTSVAQETFNSAAFLSYSLTIKRRPGYFLVNMVIPIIILGLLNGLVFLLPADSGERVGYAVTAFLTFAVFLTMVSENLPKASQPMSLLCYFLTLMLVMSALSTVITIMTLRVYHQDESTEIPKWLKHVTSFLTCRKCKKWCEKGEIEPPQRKPSDLTDEFEDEGPVYKFDYDLDDIQWKTIGELLDWFFFILFLIGNLIVSLFFLVPLATAA